MKIFCFNLVLIFIIYFDTYYGNIIFVVFFSITPKIKINKIGTYFL